MDRKIKNPRDSWNVGLKLLNPKKKDLEHGLELHRHSIVCDAYGFGPRSAIDAEILRKEIEAGASRTEIQDMMENMWMTRYVTESSKKAEYKKAWEKSGVTCILINAGEESPRRILKRLAYFVYVTDNMQDFVKKAVCAEDIISAKKENKHCLYLSSNGIPFMQEWVSVEEELQLIKTFFQLGIRMMHFTYNRRNLIGDGCSEPANSGLSDFGRVVIEEMNRTGIIIDVAHSGWQTSLEAARLSRKPVVASHSGCCALNRHCRNKPDNVIRAIADSGGYIGICCIPQFLGGRGDIKAMLDHIDYAAKKFGAAHVAIGTDRAYLPAANEKEFKKLPKSKRQRPAWAPLWPEDVAKSFSDPKWCKPEKQLSMDWTNWPLFTVGLVQRGYPDKDIQKIIGGNILRVARETLNNKK